MIKKTLRKAYNRFYRSDCEIDFNAFASRNCTLSKKVKINSGAVVSKSNLGQHVIVHNRATVSSSTIFEYSAIGEDCRVNHIELGRCSYFAEQSWASHCTLGAFCSIGPRSIIGYGLHPTNHISTNPLLYSSTPPQANRFLDKSIFTERKNITIGNDVFIGASVYIMDGITIGTGAIVAAGSVVTKNVAPYSIVGGIPAIQIKPRFKDEMISKLLESKWWEFDLDKIKSAARNKHSGNPEAFIEALSGLTKPIQRRPI